MNKHLIGRRMQIKATSNEFARKDIGQIGTVIDTVAGEMLVVRLEDGRDFWAYPHNLKPAI